MIHQRLTWLEEELPEGRAWLARVPELLGLDRERARGWAAGQAIAWGVDQVMHVEVARRLLEARPA